MIDKKNLVDGIFDFKVYDFGDIMMHGERLLVCTYDSASASKFFERFGYEEIPCVIKNSYCWGDGGIEFEDAEITTELAFFADEQRNNRLVLVAPGATKVTITTNGKTESYNLI